MDRDDSGENEMAELLKATFEYAPGPRWAVATAGNVVVFAEPHDGGVYVVTIVEARPSKGEGNEGTR